MSMRTHTIAVLVALLGFGSAFGVSRFGVHGGEADAAAARPVALDVPATVRAGKVPLPADAPALVVPRPVVPAPAPPRPRPARRAPARPASPPTPRQTQPAPAPQATPMQQAPVRPRTTAPAQTPPQAPPAQPQRAAPAPKKAPESITIIGGD
jgi:translation initiation factor IF-2